MLILSSKLGYLFLATHPPSNFQFKASSNHFTLSFLFFSHNSTPKFSLVCVWCMHYHLDQFFLFLQVEELVCLLVCIPSIQWIGHEDSMHACLHSCLFTILLSPFKKYKCIRRKQTYKFSPLSPLPVTYLPTFIYFQ